MSSFIIIQNYRTSSHKQSSDQTRLSPAKHRDIHLRLLHIAGHHRFSKSPPKITSQNHLPTPTSFITTSHRHPPTHHAIKSFIVHCPDILHRYPAQMFRSDVPHACPTSSSCIVIPHSHLSSRYCVIIPHLVLENSISNGHANHWLSAG